MPVPRSVQELDLSLATRTEAVLSRVELPASGAVADLGCATGSFAARLAERGLAVTCVDVSAENLAALERLHPGLVARGLLEPVRADLTALPIGAESVDVVFCMEVLEHVVDDRGALREARRILRPGGVLALTVPNAAAPQPLVERLGLASVHDQEGPERHVREGYDAAGVETLLSECGFDSIRVGGVGGAIFRAAAGVVSLGHLAYRRGQGQHSWTWADVERDSGSLAFRLYAVAFPLLLGLVGLERRVPTSRASTLVATATRTG